MKPFCRINKPTNQPGRHVPDVEVTCGSLSLSRVSSVARVLSPTQIIP